MSALSLTVAAVLQLLLLIPWASAQATQCAPDGLSQLRFVAQLSVSGCALFVHDTGANGGPHLAVEPIMCVLETLHKVVPRYDPITQQTYVRVPVVLRDDAMLAEVQRQLRHLSPKSVKFATVSNISVSTDASSKFQALGFYWNPEESIGFLEIGCESSFENTCACELVSRFRNYQFEVLDQVLLTVGITSKNTTSELNYRPLLQNRTFFDTHTAARLDHVPKCNHLRFVRVVRLNNCTARVHRMLDKKAHFLIEPLFCHSITSRSNESVMYDYSRDMYYLKLDIVLQDDMAVGAVMTQLADLSPRSVSFMQLWRAQSYVASSLSRRFVIGPLMVSGDRKSAQLRVHCSAADECHRLRSATNAGPVNLWKHIRYSLTSLAPGCCLMKSEFPRHPWSMQEYGKNPIDSEESVCKGASERICPFKHPCIPRSGTTLTPASSLKAVKDKPESTALVEAITTTSSPKPVPVTSPKALPTISVQPDGARRLVLTRGLRKFVVIQQRETGSVSFQRTWAEYERGFGDETDFWIGLSTIHSLSMNGAVLRVEMKLWDDTELHVEYAGFKVRHARHNYTMSYREMLKDRSSFRYDALMHNRAMPFSTVDRDHDRHRAASCSNSHGKSGWWFNRCGESNPNGLYHAGEASNAALCSWAKSRVNVLNLCEVRLMLQI